MQWKILIASNCTKIKGQQKYPTPVNTDSLHHKLFNGYEKQVDSENKTG